MSRGAFVTFEGTEGAGKSTQIRRLEQALSARNLTTLSVREPGGTEVGERVRTILKDSTLSGKLSSETELLLVAASRSELVRSVIKPALEAGKVVLCDRFVDSTVAYQGYGRGLSHEKIRQLMAFTTEDLQPDLTLLIDIPLAVSLERRTSRNAQLSEAEKSDRFEAADEAFFQRVESGFQSIAKQETERVRVIDGVGSEDAIAQRIWEAYVAAGLPH